MRIWKMLWNDERGAIMSAEMALLATVGVVGATAGMNMASTSINGEMKDVAYSLRSLDQSYGYKGLRSERAWTAGSTFTQPPVEQSIAELKALEQDETSDKPRLVEPAAPKKPTNVDPSPEKKPEPKKKRKMKEADAEAAAPVLLPPLEA